jgi:hypothetical protein
VLSSSLAVAAWSHGQATVLPCWLYYASALWRRWREAREEALAEGANPVGRAWHLLFLGALIVDGFQPAGSGGAFRGPLFPLFPLFPTLRPPASRGMTWDGMGWHGMAWDGMGRAWDGMDRLTWGKAVRERPVDCTHPARPFPTSHASGQPDKAIMTGPGLSSRYRQPKVWGVGCYLLSMCNARPKQGAQPSASPSAPAKLIHCRFFGSIRPPLPRCRGQPRRVRARR